MASENGAVHEQELGDWFAFLNNMAIQDPTLKRPVGVIRSLWPVAVSLIPQLRLPVTSTTESGIELSWRTRDGKHIDLSIARDGSVDWFYRDTPANLTIDSRGTARALPIEWQHLDSSQQYTYVGELLRLNAADNGDWWVEADAPPKIGSGPEDIEAAKAAAIAAARGLLRDALAELGGE